MPDCNRKGAILFIVVGIIMVVAVLAAALLRTISNQSRLTHHQVTRIQAQYAAKAGMVLVFDKLRRGDWSQNALVPNYYCINGPVDVGVNCPAGPSRVDDPTIPYNVQITVFPQNPPTGINGTARIEIKTDYTYTP